MVANRHELLRNRHQPPAARSWCGKCAWATTFALFLETAGFLLQRIREQVFGELFVQCDLMKRPETIRHDRGLSPESSRANLRSR